jgi:hypothetical protein
VRDKKRFFASFTRDYIVKDRPLTNIKDKPLTYSVRLRWDEGALLRDWVDSHSAVLFDFGDDNDFGDDSEPGDIPSFGGPVLWRLDPHSPRGEAHLSPVLKTSFLDACLKGLCRRYRRTLGPNGI